jgi:DNA invertase Pin-like site-specific DNA recombinase
MGKVQRVAAYVRVSTEEQKKNGFSIGTQVANIKDYLSMQKDMKLVDFYIDEGISADKIKYRAELNRLLDDVRAGKIDIIIFTKLDRWFRSVQKYYQIQSILDEYGVVWKALHEDYEIITSGGKFKVNIMLSVAQQERDRCSERIKDVFEQRIKEGYAVTGAMPLGLVISDHKIIPDESTSYIIADMFNQLELCGSVRQTNMIINAKHNLSLSYATVLRYLKNPLYCGMNRGIENYCQGIVTKEQWENAQRLIKMNVRARENNHTYVFSGLIKCGHCGRIMSGNRSTTKNTNYDYKYFRCNKANQNNSCDNRASINQNIIEDYLLTNVERLISEHIIKVESIEPKEPPKPKSNKQSIEKKMERLKELYVNGFIDMDKYKADYEALKAQIIEVEEEPIKDLTAVKKFLQSDFRSIYGKLNDTEKLSLWRSVIKEIKVSNKEVTEVVFL